MVFTGKRRGKPEGKEVNVFTIYCIYVQSCQWGKRKYSGTKSSLP